MNGMYNVLIGVPIGMSEAAEVKFESLIRKSFPGAVAKVTFSHTVEHFYERVSSGTYNYLCCIDDLGMGNEYSKCFSPHDLSNIVKYVVVIPDRCCGSAPLRRFIEDGYTNIVFQRDVGIDIVRALSGNSRDQRGAMLYGGFIAAQSPVPVHSPVREKEKVSHIKKRYLGNGIGVTRLCSQDAKQMHGGGIGENDVLRELLGGSAFDASLISETMPYREFPQDEPWVRKYKNELRAYFRRAGLMEFRSFENGDMARTQFEDIIYRELGKLKVTNDAAKAVCESFMKDTLSYGKLDVLINTPEVSDIRLLSKDVVNVQYNGKWYRTNVRFSTEEEYTQFINRMCLMNKAQLNIREADTIFTDIHTNPDYILRFMVTHGMLSASSSYSAHIRVSPKVKKTAEQLFQEGFWTREQAALLITAARKGKSFVICGGSGSGKTILLNLMIEYLPPSICGTCVQQSDELHSETHPNIEFLHSLEAAGEGGTAYDLKRLATGAVLKNVELLIIGEIKGPEAADFFTASRTAIVYTSTHSEDAFGALPRLTELAKSNADYTQEDILRILSKNIDYVVYCEDYGVKQIASVVGYDMERKDVIYDLYDFNVRKEDYE